MSKNVECVKVLIRCRPLSPKEVEDGRQMIVQMDTKRGEIVIKNPKADSSEQPKQFTFDDVYDWNSKQDIIYKESAFPIVDSVLQGYNGTIFAYGQTGTGKTHTMEGQADPPQQRGIIPRAFEHIFEFIDSSPGKQFLVRASFLELYNEEIRDLLSHNPKNKLELREKPDVGVYVKDLTAFPIQGVQEMTQKLEFGRKNRAVGETKMNRDSSRSHSIFTITVEVSDFGPDGQNHIRVGKLNLVDLAGSERQSKTQATGDRFKEAININQSLTTLGNVISSLIDPKNTHVPYRDSKLTRLLQDSLGGNTKTVMVANIGPADWNYDETLSTLRYANRAKSIKNKPKINEDPKDAMLREFQEEIATLKQQLEQYQGGQMVMKDGKPVIEKIVKVDDEKKIKEIEDKLAQEKEDIKRKADEERKKIEQQKHMAEEEKVKLLEDLKAKEELERNAKENQEKLVKKLKKMEDKLLIGTKAMEQAMKQEKEYQKIREELDAKKAREEKLKEELTKREEENVMMEKKYTSQQDEIEDKKKKLQKLYQKYQSAKAEIQDQTDEFNRERENYQEQLRDLTRQLKLRNLIIEHFIPNDEVEKIELRASWNDQVDEWMLPNLQLSGNSLRGKRPGSSLGLKRPTSEYARVAKSLRDPNPRYRADNVVDLDLDMPERTLEDYDGQVSQKIQNTINTALNEDEDDLALLNQENQPNVYYVYKDDGIERDENQAPKEKKKRLQSAVKKPTQGVRKKAEIVNKEVPPEEFFPKSKGLIKKGSRINN